MQHATTHNVFAYASNQRVVGILGGFPCILSGFEKWMRGASPSLKENLTASVRGYLYQVPVDLIDRMDVESEDYGDYHRFKTQVWDGASYHDAWTYQLIEDADDYTQAASFTLNQDLHEPAATQ